MTKTKPPALLRKYARRHVRDFVDFDYLKKLSPEEMLWLEKFSNEFYRAHFRKDVDHVHNDDARQQLYQTNNERHRDIWSHGDRVSMECSDEEQLRLAQQEELE